jgi:hypothetical protein
MSTLTTRSTPADVAAAPMAALVAFYNAASGARPVKKFETRAIGVSRCTQLLQKSTLDERIAADKAARKPRPTVRETMASAPTQAARPAPKPTAMTQLAAVVTRSKAPRRAAPAERRGDESLPPHARITAPDAVAPRFSDQSRIRILAKTCPRHPSGAAAERWALMRPGMTVAAYIEAGGWRRDIIWNARRGWIALEA